MTIATQPEPATHALRTDLDHQVEEGRTQIRTDGYTMSLGELASLYEERELEIDSRFQRFFRWTIDQKTRLVESTLLGIPLPQVVVSPRSDGVWEVLGGLQRLSALFEFMGKLRGEDGTTKESLCLTRAKYLPALDGVRWTDLSHPLRIDFRCAKVNVSILNRGGDHRAKYDLFERLNNGGRRLSEQQVRNCILVMENETIYDWLQDLAADGPFRNCVAVGERLEEEGFYTELVCRVLALSKAEIHDLTQDIGPLVTQRMVELAGDDSAHRPRLEHAFRGTFSILADDCLKEQVFRHYSPERREFRGAFLNSPFEVVACGIAHHLLHGARPSDYSAREVLEAVKALWSSGGLLAQSRAGMSAKQRLQTTIPHGRKIFAP